MSTILRVHRSLLILLLPILSSGVFAAESTVTIEIRPVNVVRKSFDPKKPPAELPKLSAGEEAVAVSWYGVDVYVRVDVDERERRKDGTVVTSNRVTSVKVTTTLDVTIWLPEKASAALKEHEEGHRRIAELYYGNAEKVARRLAERSVGRSYGGEGKGRQASIDAAIDKVTKELIDTYTKEINGPAQRAQELFDEITDHGRKRQITVDEGIKRAVERQKNQPEKAGR